MLSRLAISSRNEVSSLWSKAAKRSFSQAVVAKDEAESVLPQEITDRLNKYPAQLHDWENFKMPGAPYDGMGPLPPVPEYENVKKDLKFYFLPKSWFDFFYEKTGVTGPYVFGGAIFTMLASKEYYMFGHTYGHHSRQIFWMFVTYGLLNRAYGEQVRDYVENLRTEKFHAMDAIKEEEVQACYEVLDNVKLLKWRAGLSELYNEAKKVNLDIMLETAFLERQAQVVNRIKQKLDYQVAVQKVDAELEHAHMIEWIETKVMETITPESQRATLDACIADLHVLAEKN